MKSASDALRFGQMPVYVFPPMKCELAADHPIAEALFARLGYGFWGHIFFCLYLS